MTKVGLVRSVALALIVTGIIIGGRVIYALDHQATRDNVQDKAWQQFQGAVQGQAPSASPAPEASPSPAASPVSTLPDGLYLKMTIARVGRDAVAVDGDWNSLKTSSTVHYRDSPAPGQKGNMLIAFHREPRWLDINSVQAGDLVKIDALDRRSYWYQVDFVRIVRASDVSNLKPTTGTDLTLITCDPPWQDYNRMVIRAHLVPAPPD